MMPDTEVLSELQNEIDELRDYQHRTEKAIARIESWLSIQTGKENTEERKIVKQTLESVLRIFKEEAKR